MRRASASSHDSRRVAALVTRIITRKRTSLLKGYVRDLVVRRALPLDLSDPAPLQAALDRNIQAMLEPRSTTCGT